ncbi:hypothetical protein THAOC_08670 [Thalassiosira oceanica]|uniref:Uncharacterized protein n=1 Tax=Thalassiosira oceanica TaxID=159749 RepID=K0T9A6_THAOC|nr:hypothetical protein THAOC_08670 [Thalassiosira oceanica]|eukprot:EJK70016.1 hypothetical protein THAOC_08670 [Thalassiosira oceanica]
MLPAWLDPWGRHATYAGMAASSGRAAPSHDRSCSFLPVRVDLRCGLNWTKKEVIGRHRILSRATQREGSSGKRMEWKAARKQSATVATVHHHSLDNTMPAYEIGHHTYFYLT